MKRSKRLKALDYMQNVLSFWLPFKSLHLKEWCSEAAPRPDLPGLLRNYSNLSCTVSFKVAKGIHLKFSDTRSPTPQKGTV